MKRGLLKRSPMKRLSKDRERRRRQLVGQISAPPKEGTRRWLEKRLEALNARACKMRDGFQCQQCLSEGLPTEGILDAGHVYPKGLFPGGKYLLCNLIAQCRMHNTIHMSRPELLMTFYENSHGEGSLEKLHEQVLAMPRRMETAWLEEQIIERERRIGEMENHFAALV